MVAATHDTDEAALRCLHDMLIGDERPLPAERLRREVLLAVEDLWQALADAHDALAEIVAFAALPEPVPYRPLPERAVAAVRRLCRTHRSPLALLPQASEAFA